MLNREIINYSQFRDVGKDKIGNKAFNIGILNENNILVPRGIVLTCSLWEKLKQDKKSILAYMVWNEVLRRISASKYIVRSSALIEDSANLSWAGCFDTIPDVAQDDLLNAIYDCGNSVESLRVEMYAKLHSVLDYQPQIAVLIQEYIISDWNGVCFTSNPINNNSDEYLIEIQKGITGGVVGGYGRPYNLRYDKKSKNVVENHNYKIKEIDELLDIVEQISNVFGENLDIEWMISNNKIYILQVRKITTMGE